METETTKKIRKHLNDTGMEVFLCFLYPALKKKFENDATYDIDYRDICTAYPEYAIRAESDKSKRSRLSRAKSILRNGWEREALTIIFESKRLDSKLIQMAKNYIDSLDD